MSANGELGNFGHFKNTKCIITLGVSMRMSWALASREKKKKNVKLENQKIGCFNVTHIAFYS